MSEKAGITLSAESEKEAPIKYGEVFDAEAELKEILKHKTSEREEAFARYKEKFAYQKEGLSEMQRSLLQMIEANPDLSIDELSGEVAEFGGEFGFTVGEKLAIFKELSKFVQRRANMRETLQDFTKDSGVGIDGKKFFAAAFGSMPAGEVEVLGGPFNVLLRCANEDDYAEAVKVDHILGGDSMAAANRLGRGSLGVNLRRTLLSDLDRMVTLENTNKLWADVGQFNLPPDEAEARVREESRNIFIHEERHTLNSYFKDVSPERAEHLAAVAALEDEETKQTELRLYFRETIPLYAAMAKDEFIAQATALKSPEELKAILEEMKGKFVGGYYDYRDSTLQPLVRYVTGKVGNANEALVRKAAEEAFGARYEREIAAAIDAFDAYLGGDYSRPKVDEAIRRLSTVPFFSWKKEVKRFGGKSAQ